jgi:hypothetical protein
MLDFCRGMSVRFGLIRGNGRRIDERLRISKRMAVPRLERTPLVSMRKIDRSSIEYLKH